MFNLTTLFALSEGLVLKLYVIKAIKLDMKLIKRTHYNVSVSVIVYPALHWCAFLESLES